MKRMVLTILAAAVAAALTACGPVHSKDSPPSVRTLMRRAADARGGGDLRAAAALYEQAVEASLPTDGRRAEALYWSGMLHLSPDPGLRDLVHARRALEELKRGWPGFDRGQEAELGIALADDLGACENDAEAARAAEAQSGAACAGEKADLAGKLEAAQEELKADRAELKTALADAKAARAEAAKLREDNKTKDEALQRVREVLKDWKPKR